MIDQNVIQLSEVRAHRYMEEGNFHVSQGQIPEAIESFKKSAETLPSAEAYTFWAWMLSFQGKYEESIELCKKAIDIDSDFGNPYNDIGSYLIRLGKLDDAIAWLERAKRAKRYEPKHFPYINLGRVYLALGNLKAALKEFRKALVIFPTNSEIQKVVHELEQEIK